MFGKSKTANDSRVPASVQQFERLAAAGLTTESADVLSSIGADVTIVGKITGTGTIRVAGRVEGELRAATVLISDGAEVEGDVVAEDVTIGGRLKGTIHADRVRLNGSAVVQGDIFHRSLAIEENARFEGSSRREDKPAEAASRLQASRAQAVVVAQSSGVAQPAGVAPDGSRKLNGAPGESPGAAAG